MILNQQKEKINFENENETLFAIYIDGEKASQLPSKKEGYVFDEEKSFCNNGVDINWSYPLWTASVDFADYKLKNKERTYCSLYFRKEEYLFDYTGSEQEFAVTKDGYYQIELWGASGADYDLQGNYYSGGKGSYVSGIISLSKETKLYLYVGKKGIQESIGVSYGVYSFNGGSGGNYTCYNGNNGKFAYNYYGGSATDVRLVNGNWNEFDSLKSRIMVAGAGSSAGPSSDGASAGGLIGYDGNQGTGGTQTAGGNIKKGGFGWAAIPNYGGSYCNDSELCGAGSGYYGGGHTNATGDRIKQYIGGGGSSFISGHNGCDAIKEESTANNIIHTGQPNHFSGNVFESTKMIDGQGYFWTNTKQAQEAMPNPKGGYYGLGNGHIGDGYVRVTYLGR